MNVVDHLEELRTRLIVSLATVAVASGLCFWQNHQLLRLVNAPLAQNTQELTVTLIFALILSLPVLLLQTYGFLMPAFDPLQQRRMLPVTLSIPILFAVGVAFGYLVVLPASLHFFQNFNSDQFNVLVQASQYYTFAATILLAMGLLFQVPVAIIAATRAGLITPRQLRRHRRWAVLACCAVAAIIPGDVITMLLETVPPYLLFELSVLIAAWSERRAARRAARAAALATTKKDENTHVAALKKALGSKAAKKPAFDFGRTVTDKATFAATAYVLENTGVHAYIGQAFNITTPAYLGVALSIVTVEARHSGAIGLYLGKPIAPNGPFDNGYTAAKVLAAVNGTGFIRS